MTLNHPIRELKHFRKNYPLLGDTTGKRWFVPTADRQVAEFLFSPYRSVFQTANKIQVIDPVDYDNQKKISNTNQYVVSEYNGQAFEKVGNLDCRFPFFFKPKFTLNYKGQTLELKGKTKIWSSPGIDTTIKSKEGKFQCDARFLDPALPQNANKKEDCQILIEGNHPFWMANLQFVVFFLEMDMIQNIRRAMS